jgi:hypothetical protein
MVLTTGVTATAGMLPVLADTTVTVGNVTAQLPGLLLARGHPAQAFLQSETTHYLSSLSSQHLPFILYDTNTGTNYKRNASSSLLVQT